MQKISILFGFLDSSSFFKFLEKKVWEGVSALRVRAVLPVMGLEPMKQPAEKMLTRAGVEPAALSHL